MIENLEMKTDRSLLNDFEHLLCNLCLRLPRLSKLTLPIYHFTQKVATALSRCETLNAIILDSDIDEDNLLNPYSLSGIQPFACELQPNAFQSLRHLAFAAAFEDASSFLTQANFPSTNILSLRIHIVHEREPEKKNALPSFLDALSRNFPSLGTLEVILARSTDDYFPLPPPKRSFSDIVDLLPFSRLTNFRIQDANPLLATDADVQALASRWPSLKEFALDHCPSTEEIPTLPATSLIHFARHCPKLRKLVVYVDVLNEDNSRPSPLAFNTNRTTIPRMLSLEELDVGFSPTVGIRYRSPDKTFVPISRFLTSLLRDPSVLKWRFDEDDEELIARGKSPSARVQGWETIRAMLSLLFEKEMAVIAVEKDKEEYRRKYEAMLALV